MPTQIRALVCFSTPLSQDIHYIGWWRITKGKVNNDLNKTSKRISEKMVNELLRESEKAFFTTI
jgi:hypothetical protein